MARSDSAFYGWKLVWVLGITTMVSYGTTQYLFAVLLVPIEAELGWSRPALSGAFALGLAVSGLLGLAIGQALDRGGARVLMTAGSALGGIALLALSRVTEIWQFYLLWAGAIALANALTFYPVTFTVVASWFARRRGAALARLALLGGLALPVFVPLAGVLVARLGWRGTLVGFGLAQLLIALPAHARFVRGRPEDLGLHPDGLPRPPDRSDPGGGHHFGEAVRSPAFWTLTASGALSLLGASVLLAHQVAYLIARGLDPVLAASVGGVAGLASLPGRFLISLLSDRLGPRPLLGACCAAQAAGVALLQAPGRVTLAGYVVLFGAAFGAVSPLRASMMAGQFGRRAYGAITSMQGVPIALAAAGGPLVAGLLYDRLGGYELALRLTALAFLLSGVGVLITPPPRPPGDRPSPPEPVPAVP